MAFTTKTTTSKGQSIETLINQLFTTASELKKEKELALNEKVAALNDKEVAVQAKIKAEQELAVILEAKAKAEQELATLHLDMDQLKTQIQQLSANL